MLITASLRPDGVRLDLPGYTEKIPRIDDVSVLDIGFQYGKLAIEVRDQKLLLGLAPSEELPPNFTVTVSYHRVNDLYYPEVLMAVPGYAQISRRPE